MNKKILFSVSTIAIVAAIVIGGTIAYFSDTETSNGNIFTAGSIDLKVDHLAQTYNTVDCKTCSVQVYSSPATTDVVAGTPNASSLVFPTDAVDVASPHPAWQNETALSPAQWIWATEPTTVADTTNGAEYTFENKFQWNGTAVSVNLDLALAADNGYKIILNGAEIVNKIGDEFNYGTAVQLTAGEETNFINAMVANGENTLDIVVRNKILNADPVTGNPGGLLFKLNVNRNPAECAADSQFQQNCRLWQATDLTDQKFFNFGDIKPQDEGTNLISLHVASNDAFVCLIPNNVTNDENGVVDPELEAGDTADDGPGHGELQNAIEFFGWKDDGDGVYQAGEGILIPAGTSLSDIQAHMISMPLATTSTGYIGLAWCAGTQTVSGSTISCDGDGMSNIVQTDKAMADLVAYAVQQRNNPNFSCANVILPTN